MAKLVQDGATYIPDSLIVDGNVPLLHKGIAIKKGIIAKRGTVIAIDEATTNGVVADKAKAENIVVGVLTDDVDATEGDAVTTMYITGHFNKDDLIFAEGTILEDYEMELRKLGIYTETVKGGN